MKGYRSLHNDNRKCCVNEFEAVRFDSGFKHYVVYFLWNDLRWYEKNMENSLIWKRNADLP